MMEKEDHTSHATIYKNGILRFRKVPPAHYTFKIESVSTLLETKVKKIETKDFEAGGYKWRMVLYPNGKQKEDGKRHISLFLELSEPAGVSLGWEVNTTVNFFLFDGIRDRYLAVEDADQMDWRFHKMKMEWGFIEFLSHDALCDPLNGYLVDDRCIFGVEIFVIKSSGEGESISIVKEPKTGVHTWNVYFYSASLMKAPYKSHVFVVEGRKWHLELYANGDSRASRTHLSLFLHLDDPKNLRTGKLDVKCLLRIKDQCNNHNHHERTVTHEFGYDKKGRGWGFSEFMLLSTLKNPSNGYLVNGLIIMEVKFDLISVVEDFSFKKKSR